MASSVQSSARDAGTSGLTRLETLTIALLAFTAATHLYAGVVESAPPVLLAGIGFVGGIVLYVRGVRQRTLILAAIPYTAVQIPLWYVAKAGEYTLVGYADKVAQVVLIVALVALLRRR
jgi:hypothetical protein